MPALQSTPYTNTTYVYEDAPRSAGNICRPSYQYGSTIPMSDSVHIHPKSSCDPNPALAHSIRSQARAKPRWTHGSIPYLD